MIRDSRKRPHSDLEDAESDSEFAIDPALRSERPYLNQEGSGLERESTQFEYEPSVVDAITGLDHDSLMEICERASSMCECVCYLCHGHWGFDLQPDPERLRNFYFIVKVNLKSY